MVTKLLSAQIGGTVVVGDINPTYIDSMVLVNTTAALAYVQIFWVAAASVTLNSTVPDVVIPLPPSGGAVLHFGDGGWKTLGTAWSLACTTTRTGSSAALVDVTIWKRH